MKRNYEDLTPSEKGKITKAVNKAFTEYEQATDESRNAYYDFLQKEIIPTRDSAIELAEKIRDEKIADAVAQFEKDRKQALDWQENHPEVVRLDKIRDEVFEKQIEIFNAKRNAILTSFGVED